MATPNAEFEVSNLGGCTVPSPLRDVRFVRGKDRLLFKDDIAELRACIQAGGEPASFELAGPREQLFFDPSRLKCGIVTCGGLCPGLNDVIRAIVVSLRRNYGVQVVYGFQFGYEGLIERYGHPPVELTVDTLTSLRAMRSKLPCCNTCSSSSAG